MWVLFLLSSLLSNFSLLTNGEHKFYLSSCVIEYNQPSQALQISLHIFLDDMEDALQNQGLEKQFLCTELEKEDAEKHFFKYLQDNFQLTVNGVSKNYNYIGKEISEDLAAVWCYLEIEDIQKVEEIEIYNSILVEIFEDQKNVVSIHIPGNKEAFKVFNKDDLEETIPFK